jgi:hypothetical protein
MGRRRMGVRTEVTVLWLEQADEELERHEHEACVGVHSQPYDMGKLRREPELALCGRLLLA